MTETPAPTPLQLTMWEKLRKKFRQDKLARREKATLPFGSTRESVKANRNLFYLLNKGMIAARPKSVRVANELVANDDDRSSNRLLLLDKAAAKGIIHQQANAVWLNGREASVPFPSLPDPTPHGNKRAIMAMLATLEEFQNLNAEQIK